jgi:hypothetical protein
MNGTVLMTVLLAMALYQLYVTVRVFRSHRYSMGQRIAQLSLIWLFPLLGAIICHAFLGADEQQSVKRDNGFIADGGSSPSGIGSDGAGH